MDIAENIAKIKSSLSPQVRLIAVSKTYPASAIEEAYQSGQKIFGENKVQEMAAKQTELPEDIEWHLIGHLQSNKVKYIAPFVAVIHSVDSLKLLKEINKQAAKNQRTINCLLQIHIAQESTKFGLSFDEAEALYSSEEVRNMPNIHICGLMGMATNTDNTSQVKKEFESLHSFFEKLKSKNNSEHFRELSMGMSSDYETAIAAGSTMVRIGSAIFGARNYQ